MRNITGADGELISRFMELLRGTGDDLNRLRNHGVYVELIVGDNSPLPGVILIPEDEESQPGSQLEVLVQQRRRVGPDEWLALLADRLEEIVDFGVSEDFLIRALRDHLTEVVRNFADVGSTTENRKQTRLGMLKTADDPERLARLRARLAEQDPAYQDMPLDQVASSLRDMAELNLAAPSADEAAARWAELDAWERDSSTLLGDDAIETWSRRRMTR